jgi:SAM-dependent methyltransferase
MGHPTDDTRDEEFRALLRADLIAEFEKRLDPTFDADYRNREDRNRFAATFIRTLGAERILNIGSGGRRHLASKLGDGCTVFEADLVGDCDLKVDLDTLERLPFADGHFDLSSAFDVLEHRENFHFVNQELWRVAGKAMLLSLPNAGPAIVSEVLRNRPPRNQNIHHGVYTKFYGLPLVKPRDRHRWWLFFEDIVRFYVWFEKHNACSVAFAVPRPKPARRLLAALVGKRLYYTFFCPHVWILLRRKT